MPCYLRHFRVSQKQQIQQAHSSPLREMVLDVSSSRGAWQARALVLQTFLLAVVLGVLTVEDKQELDKESMREDPTILVNAWLESALPIVEQELSVLELGNSEARMVGVLMLVTLKGVNPQRDLQNFLQRFNH